MAPLLAFLYGITDELHQLTVPNRTVQALDLVWDGLGRRSGSASRLCRAPADRSCPCYRSDS